MAEKEKLRLGTVYPTFLRVEEKGPYLYLGTRRRFNIKRLEYPEPVHVIVGYHKGKVASWRFDEKDYFIREENLVLQEMNRINLDGRQMGYLEERLERAGVFRKVK